MMLLDTPVCDFGWQAPDFTLKDAHGAAHAMSAYLGEKGLLIAFICNHCPYVKTLGARLAEDTAHLRAQGINTLGVMSNDWRDHPEDAPEMLPKAAAQHGWQFPYLIDADQAVGKAYGAVCTPDFFGLNGAGELQFRGRLDDAGMGDGAGRTRELVIAMEQIAATGQGPREQTASMGCSIKWS